MGRPVMLLAICGARCPERLMVTLPARKLQLQRDPETFLACKWEAKTGMYAHLPAESLLHLSASLSVQKCTVCPEVYRVSLVCVLHQMPSWLTQVMRLNVCFVYLAILQIADKPVTPHLCFHVMAPPFFPPSLLPPSFLLSLLFFSSTHSPFPPVECWGELGLAYLHCKSVFNGATLVACGWPGLGVSYCGDTETQGLYPCEPVGKYLSA